MAARSNTALLAHTVRDGGGRLPRQAIGRNNFRHSVCIEEALFDLELAAADELSVKTVDAGQRGHAGRQFELVVGDIILTKPVDFDLPIHSGAKRIDLLLALKQKPANCSITFILNEMMFVVNWVL
jgi:hypothetical protein